MTRYTIVNNKTGAQFRVDTEGTLEQKFIPLLGCLPKEWGNIADCTITSVDLGAIVAKRDANLNAALETLKMIAKAKQATAAELLKAVQAIITILTSNDDAGA
jgi:hypothetical protein